MQTYHKLQEPYAFATTV